MTGGTCYALLTGEPLYPANQGPDQWYNPLAFKNPAAATAIGQTDLAPLGGEPSQVRAPDFLKFDTSIQKAFRMPAGSSSSCSESTSRICSTVLTSAAPGTSTSASGQAPPAGVTNFTNLQNFGRLTCASAAAERPAAVPVQREVYVLVRRSGAVRASARTAHTPQDHPIKHRLTMYRR